jgi:ABC-type xylose transport system permease subunit
MKTIQYFFLMILVVLLELGLVYSLFAFASFSKMGYFAFVVILVLLLIFISIASRFREKIKIKPKSEVFSQYRRGFLNTLLFVAITLVGIIVVRMIFFVAAARFH